MIFGKSLKNNIIYKILKNACGEIYHDNDAKALALFRRESRLRAKLLRQEIERDKLIMSMFLMFSKKSYDIIDLIIFSAITDVKIQFEGEFSFINNFLEVKTKEDKDFYLVYDSNVMFDTADSNANVAPVRMKLPSRIYTISFERALRIIRRNLMDKIQKNGINPVPFFESSGTISTKTRPSLFDFKNTNFVSYVNHEPTILSEEQKDSNPDVIPIKVTKEDMDCFYDIDGIHGFVFRNELSAFKELFNLKYSKNNKNKPITKNRYVSDGGSIRDLKNLFSVHFAEMFLPCIGGERINFYLVFNFNEKTASKRQCESIRELIYDEILFEIRETISSSTLIHCNLSFLKSRSESQTTIQADDMHSDIIDDDCLLTGKIDSVFISNVIHRISLKLSKEKMMVFFETYGTKNIFSDVSLRNITCKLNNLIDLSLLNVNIDICCNLGVKGMKNKTICCPEKLIENIKYGIEYYYLFNCSDFATFHGTTVKVNPKNSISEYITLFTNGIYKVNIYVPLLTQFLPRSFRTMTFPCYTASLASKDFYGWSASASAVKKLNKLISNLLKTRENFKQHMNLNVGLRAEFRISSINIPMFDSFSKSIFIDRELRCCETIKLIQAIQQGIDELVTRLNATRNSTIEKIVKIGIYEIFYLEKYIRGGKNLHILPNSVKESFLLGKTNNKICKAEEFEIPDLSIEEQFKVISKLFKYNKSLKDKDKTSFLKLLKFIEIDKKEFNSPTNTHSLLALNENSVIIEGLVECLIRSIKKEYKISETLFYHGCPESNKFNALPMSSAEIIKQYFAEPFGKFIYEIYFGLYKYLSSRYSLEIIHSLILASLKSKEIKYIIKYIVGKGPKLRLISYLSTNSDEEVESKKKLIVAGIKRWTDHNLDKKRERISLSEHILVYNGLHNDIYGKSNKKNLFDDTRYPFWMYTEKYKLENCFKTYMKTAERHNISFSEEVKYFDIDKISLEQTIEFLNINNRQVESANIIKCMDEVHAISRNKEFITKENDYYENLFKWQGYNFSKTKDSYAFLLSTESSFNNAKLPGNSFEASDLIDVSSFEVETPKTIDLFHDTNSSSLVRRESIPKRSSRLVCISSSSESSDFVILESNIYSNANLNKVPKCVVKLPPKENFLVNDSVVKETGREAVCFSKKDDATSYLFTDEEICSSKSNPLFNILAYDNLVITPLGKKALDSISSRATRNSKKLFLNNCKKDFFFSGIKFPDVLKFIKILEKFKRVTIISIKERATRIDISNLGEY